MSSSPRANRARGRLLEEAICGLQTIRLLSCVLSDPSSKSSYVVLVTSAIHTFASFVRLFCM
jgi:hypothetical protein